MENFNFTINVIDTIKSDTYLREVAIECGNYDDFITRMFGEKVYETEQGVDWDDYRVNRSVVNRYFSIVDTISELELTASDYGVGK